MRLLNTSNFEVKLFVDNKVPPYAILSHTWDEEEVTLQDMEGNRAANKKGYEKIKSCCSVARADGFEYVWIDTRCIDKTSSAELSEAINSMFRWYSQANVCYAHPADLPFAQFGSSRWFTRGWTLQELLAPPKVLFFDSNWSPVGTRRDLSHEISTITGISEQFLQPLQDDLGPRDDRHNVVQKRLNGASIARRMS